MSLNEDKTRPIAFGRHAAEDRKRRRSKPREIEQELKRRMHRSPGRQGPTSGAGGFARS